MTRSDRLFIGVGGHIVSVDVGSGQELWRTKVGTASISTVHLQNGRLYGAAAGELVCLDPATGTIHWRNKLKGLGLGVVVFAGSGDAGALGLASQPKQGGY